MTVVVKLGSAIVADEDGALRAEVLDAVCGQVAKLHDAGENVVLVTSGAIAKGIRELGLGRRPVAMDELQAASAVGQGPLFRAYESRLEGRGVASAQVLLTFFDMIARSNYINARDTLLRLLEWRVVPIVNENDTTATDEITFGDNDVLSAQVAVLLGARLLVLLTHVEGVFTADPNADADARLVDRVEDFSELEGHRITEGTGALGTGGMRSKIVAAEMAVAGGTEVVICDGTRDGTLLAAAGGQEVGTRFPPHPEPISSFKLWLRFAKPSQGTLRVDDGAARALREGGKSLLPVGIVEVEGGFHPGDAVEVVHDGATVGKGVVNYSAAELRAIKGLKTAEAQERLPHGTEEAIHRDRFVLSS